MHGTGNKIVITMINFINLDKGQPYKLFHKKYKDALKEGQKSIEAISICSFDSIQHEVNSRYVNLKMCIGQLALTKWNKSLNIYAMAECGRTF